MTVLFLPIPPSANNLFPTGRSGKRFISLEYKAWKEAAGSALDRQAWAYHLGKTQVHYEYARFPDNRRRDLANLEKACSDILVSHGVISDDCLIQRLTLEWSYSVPQGQVRATIEDWREP